jgi:hypothetical protein
MRPTGQFVFGDLDGATRLTFALQADVTGLKKLLMGGAVQKTMDAEVAATARLKEVLEASPAG